MPGNRSAITQIIDYGFTDISKQRKLYRFFCFVLDECNDIVIQSKWSNSNLQISEARKPSRVARSNIA